MNKGLLSVIIPSRTELYLQKTIDDLLIKAEGEIEIIVVLDGYWPTTPVHDDMGVVVLHHGMQHNNFGFRPSINKGISLSNGEYVMKTDQHCVFDQGFDVKLKADCENNWVVIPSRYSLDGPTWTIPGFKKPPDDYWYPAYPFLTPTNPHNSLTCRRWKERDNLRKDILIDDTMDIPGSCYLMKRSFWDKLELLDNVNYGNYMIHEPEEVSFKAWLTGGRVIINKKTWYAHLHRHRIEGRRYGYSNRQERKNKADSEKARLFCRDYWLKTKDYLQDFGWLVDKFWPVPDWPENWREQIKIDTRNELQNKK